MPYQLQQIDCEERSQVIRWLWELLDQMEPEDSAESAVSQ